MSKWKTVKLGEVCIINPKDVIDNDEMQVSFIPMQKVSESGDIDASEIRIAKEVMKGFTSFAEDDVLMAKITPCMENGKGAIARGLFNKRGFGSTEFFVIRPNTSVVCSEWVYYYTTQKNFRINCERNMTGSAGQKRVPKNYLEKCLLPLPPLETQKQIAANLDKATQTIDLCNAILEKLDLLVKARFVEMFGTENEFEKWNCCSVWDVSDVCVGVVIKPTQYYTETGTPAFRSLNIGEMYVKDKDWVYFTEEGHQKNQKSVIRENDVLVVRSGAPGTACVATKQFAGFNAVDIIIAHPDQSKINSVFLAMFTNMPHGMNQIRGNTGGAAQQHFNVGGYKALRLILPPLELQNQFATFVEKTDRTKAAVKQVLAKAETLKKALMQEYFG